MIEIYLLEALAAFDEYKTLSAAAEHLHISQPALSRSMKKLEEMLGVSLFYRTKNSIALNDTGKLAAKLAAEILSSEEQMIRTIRYYDQSLHTISIGSTAPGPNMELPSLMMQIYPQMTITYETGQEEHLIEGLENGKYNIIILSHPVEKDDLISLPYISESLFVSAPPAHPITIKKDIGVTFKEINGSTFLQYSNVGPWEEIKKKMMPDSKILKQDTMDSLNELVNASSLLSFATDISLRTFRKDANPNRIFIPIIDPEATIHFFCILKKENKLDAFIHYLQSTNL